MNFTNGAPDETADDSNFDDVPQFTIWMYFISIILWVAAWGYSGYRMYAYIGTGDLTANILFIGSIAMATMLGTHYLLDYWIEDYSNTMYDLSDK